MKCAKCLLNKLKNMHFGLGMILLLIIAIIFPCLTIRLITPIDTSIPILSDICTFLASVKEDSDWIGFWGNYFGGVSGGIITVIVFFWTIKDSDKTRKEEHRLQIIPVLDYEVLNINCKNYRLSEESKKTLGNIKSSEKGDFSFQLEIELQVCNIGLGPAQKVILENCQCDEIVYLGEEKIGTIPNKDEKNIRKKFSIVDNYDREIGWQKTITCNFSFVDMFGNKYRQKFDMKVHYLFGVKEDGSDEWNCEIVNQDPAELVS